MTNPTLFTVSVLIAGLGSLIAGEAAAQTQPSAAVGEGRGVVVAERATVSATVEDVDRSQRMVTLKGPQGRSVTLKVPDEVKNFDQIDVGDVIQAEYLDAVAIVVAPAGTPPDIINKLNAAFRESLAPAETRARLDTLGAEIKIGTPAEFEKMLADELAKWTAVVKAANIKVE